MSRPDEPVRVLIADDVDDIRLLVRINLEASGRFDVVGEAADGRQAIDLTREHQPDVVVLDLSMPVMDGLEALPEILDAAPAAQVVVLSAHNAVDVRDAARRQGAVGYLDKSIAGESLARALLAIVTHQCDRDETT